MFGKLNESEIEELLSSEVLGRIACHYDGVTYIVPISYAYDGENIYCHSAEGMKIEMMRKNPKVCFETSRMTDMANWRSVVCWGTFEEITAAEKRSKALSKLVDRMLPLVSSQTTHLFPDWPFPPSDLNEIRGIVFKIVPEAKTGRFERNVHVAKASSESL